MHAATTMGNEVKVLAWPETIGAYWIIITISLVLSVFVPRLWRKGCTRTCRWFSRVSRRGPFFRCCCWSVRASLGRCFVKGAVLPAAVKVRAAVSKAATITWQHEPSTVLSDDSFELEVRLRGEGNEWRSVYTGGDTSHRVPELLPDSVFEARVRTKNQSGCSEFTEPVSFCTRQVCDIGSATWTQVLLWAVGLLCSRAPIRVPTCRNPCATVAKAHA